jgi:hypothetical protein
MQAKMRLLFPEAFDFMDECARLILEGRSDEIDEPAERM